MVSVNKVLIVEDDLVVQLHMKVIVRELGYDVCGLAASANEAVQSASICPPSVVLMDIRLAGDRDGIELARELRTRHDLAVVFVTAYADEQTVERAEEVGADGYLVKPFSKPQMRAALSTALARGKSSSATAVPKPAQALDPSRLVPFGAGTRMAIFSHDTFGLGHLKRSLNVSSALAQRFPGLSILLMTGSQAVHRFPLPPGVDTLKLPAVRKTAPERYEARTLDLSDENVFQMRSNVALRALQDYNPNVLLVDHAPLGMKGELRPALEWLGRNRPDCLRVIGLREVIDAPERVREQWREQGIYRVLEDLYEHVLVYGPQEFFDPREDYDFPPQLRAKTRFCNFVAEREQAAEDPDGSVERHVQDDSRPLVVATIGGGDGGLGLIEAILGALRSAASPTFRLVVLPGPFLATAERERLGSLAQNLPVEFVDFVPSSSPYLRRADLVVCTGGYNTMVQTLRFAKRALVVPRRIHREEQILRARRLSEMGLVSFIAPADADTKRMEQEVSRLLVDPSRPLTEMRKSGQLRFDGAERIAEFMAGLRVAPTVT